MSKERLYIFDTTLRDGAQTQGVDFSIEDKEQWEKYKKDNASISETEIRNKIDLRNKARADKDYKEADRIRDELLDKGVLIEDKDGKTLWKFK